MTTRCLLCASAILALPLLQPHVAAQSPPALTIVSTGPSGETSALEQANEIRVVFSEPMVVLGRIPQPVMAPFFRITPAVAGTFRWSGTTILIFTPDPRRKLPHATRFDVTVEVSATAVSGRRLAVPYTFAFTTPTVKLLAANWYRKSKRYDSPMVIALRFLRHAGGRRRAQTSCGSAKREWSPRKYPPKPSAPERIERNPRALFREGRGSPACGVCDRRGVVCGCDGLGHGEISALARSRRARSDNRGAAGKSCEGGNRSAYARARRSRGPCGPAELCAQRRTDVLHPRVPMRRGMRSGPVESAVVQPGR